MILLTRPIVQGESASRCSEFWFDFNAACRWALENSVLLYVYVCVWAFWWWRCRWDNIFLFVRIVFKSTKTFNTQVKSTNKKVTLKKFRRILESSYVQYIKLYDFQHKQLITYLYTYIHILCFSTSFSCPFFDCLAPDKWWNTRGFLDDVVSGKQNELWKDPLKPNESGK